MLKHKLIILSIFCLFIFGNAIGELDPESLNNNTENTNSLPHVDVNPYSFLLQTTSPENQYQNQFKTVTYPKKHEHLTLNVLQRLGVPLPEDIKNLDHPITLHDLKIIGFKLPQTVNILNDTLTIDELREIGTPWHPKMARPDRSISTEDLKSLGFDWIKDVLSFKQRKLIFSDLKKLGYPLPPDVNPLNTLTMADLEKLSQKEPLPSELHNIRSLTDVLRVIEKNERPLIDLLVTLGMLGSLDAEARSKRKSNDQFKPEFLIAEPNCKFKKEFKGECIGNVSSYCQYDMSRYFLPSPWKIKNWCCGVNGKINCALKWLRSCDSPIETSDYTNGKAFIISDFCNDSIKVQKYSELGTCYDRLKTEWNYCYREFESHLITLYDMISYNELHAKDSVNFCCARARFQGCVMQILNSEMQTNDSICTQENVDALKQFTLVFSKGLSFRSCGGFIVSECQYVDGPFSLTMERLEFNAGLILSANLIMILWFLYFINLLKCDKYF